MTFGFNKPNTNINKQTVNDSVQSPVEGVDTIQQSTTSKIDIEKGADREDLSENQPYTDVRSITIMLVKNTSLYRKANDKVLPKRIDYIGSCFNSSKVISANQEEVNAYFPNLDEKPEWRITGDSEEQTYFDLEFYFLRYEKVK